ncbi:MAG: hypothetical protein LBT02_04055, partial [Rickettsiales bacterium]|nr:hypothetical protein [Rickettsiales bacterium]
MFLKRIILLFLCIGSIGNLYVAAETNDVTVSNGQTYNITEDTRFTTLSLKAEGGDSGAGGSIFIT